MLTVVEALLVEQVTQTTDQFLLAELAVEPIMIQTEGMVGSRAVAVAQGQKLILPLEMEGMEKSEYLAGKSCHY